MDQDPSRFEVATLPTEAGRRDFDALEERLLEFAARCGKVVDALPDSRLGKHIAGQLVRCGTAAAPHYAEARAAESRADFIHKMGIALKELRESHVWLKMSIRCELLSEARLNPICDECGQLVGIFTRSIMTAKQNRQKNGLRKRANASSS